MQAWPDPLRVMRYRIALNFRVHQNAHDYVHSHVVGMACMICLVLSPDRHALRAKRGLEQLLQILGPSVKCLSTQKGLSLQ